VYYSSSSADTLTQANNTSFKIRPNAWWLVLAYQCLVMTLPAFKLLHVSTVAEWSWLWIMLPVWGPSALLVLVLGIEQMARLGKAKEGTSVHSLTVESIAG
jgi:hypothetical protein